MTRTYSELIRLNSFEERFEYLRLPAKDGPGYFNIERLLGQRFYHSDEWGQIRDAIIVRDMGCDLAMPGYDLYDEIIIHHMNPITSQDVAERNPDILNPEFLVCVSKTTHNLIHYGADKIVVPRFVTRSPNDMCPWKM